MKCTKIVVDNTNGVMEKNPQKYKCEMEPSCYKKIIVTRLMQDQRPLPVSLFLSPNCDPVNVITINTDFILE